MKNISGVFPWAPLMLHRFFYFSTTRTGAGMEIILVGIPAPAMIVGVFITVRQVTNAAGCGRNTSCGTAGAVTALRRAAAIAAGTSVVVIVIGPLSPAMGIPIDGTVPTLAEGTDCRGRTGGRAAGAGLRFSMVAVIDAGARMGSIAVAAPLIPAMVTKIGLAADIAVSLSHTGSAATGMGLGLTGDLNGNDKIPIRYVFFFYGHRCAQSFSTGNLVKAKVIGSRNTLCHVCIAVVA